ncbi:hypothetical protein N7489_003787 [Penicillium chrysogenum]|jgi:hypothetical protein|uniref:Uncharacterized protein n=1 Tax=Penicillium chrysogenum TaxID=5076 RepID=A0ABQ8WSI7_PENCH|nr:uncharacterized protein N7489_003787 [Penicillium chrysogenum]KAJ5243691.1 hypothetical protein N7489_003787 [Penicillium chrysogenum]KAJ5257462.1 hypothetical protein N7524_009018 [Penicillium chrysogenum]KAJ5275711.1 hypothetical protein N7505_004256 [Penicillium chrysogenum]KAJ6140766.1 hypothetical protein N7497_011659 [Penicillium chrysogenum]
MELRPDTFVGRHAGSESSEDLQSPLGHLRVLLQHVPWAFGVPEGDHDKGQTDRGLDNMGDAPGDIVG